VMFRMVTAPERERKGARFQGYGDFDHYGPTTYAANTNAYAAHATGKPSPSLPDQATSAHSRRAAPKLDSRMIRLLRNSLLLPPA
jgi:hypothetical protein